MATERTSEDVVFGSVQARTRTSGNSALSAIQQSTSGAGKALDVRSDNADAPAAEVRGAGDLLVLRNADGTAKLTVAQSGALTTSGAQTVTGDYAITGDLTVNGGAVFNEASADEDFRVESNGNANMLFVDGGQDRVAVGNAAPVATLDVVGTLYTSDSALGIVGPADHGVVAWSYDPSLALNTTTLTGGTVYLSALYIPRDVSITKLYFWIATAGATPTAGQNEVGIYSSAGTKLQSTNVDADISSTGLKTITITSQALTAGAFYWVGMVFNASTIPTVARGVGSTGTATACNVGLTAATFRYATNGTSQTSLPASITPASNTAGAFAGPWVAAGT